MNIQDYGFHYKINESCYLLQHTLPKVTLSIFYQGTSIITIRPMTNENSALVLFTNTTTNYKYPFHNNFYKSHFLKFKGSLPYSQAIAYAIIDLIKLVDIPKDLITCYQSLIQKLTTNLLPQSENKTISK